MTLTPGRVLGSCAFVLGALAAVAGSPTPPLNGQVDVNALAAMISKEEDHVTALSLAEWIKDRREGLRVIDVRSPEDYDAYHIPSADNIPLTDLTRTRLSRTNTLVLYSDGGAHAAQAWVLLRSLGFTRVYFLRGGLGEWLDDVMSPVIAPNASKDEQADFAKTAELSRFFGGTPTVGTRPDTTAASKKIAARQRRGC